MLKIKGRDAPHVDIMRLVCDFLSEEHTGPWLMILDNADDRTLLSVDHARQEDSTSSLHLLSSYLPQGSHGSILITSRDRSVAEDLTGSASSIVHVVALDEVDSVRLLRERSGDIDSPDEDAVELVRCLDNHALAITVAAAFISNGMSRTSITKYLKTYRKALKHQRLDTAVHQAVSMTWQLSFDAIRKRYPDSLKLLALMSLLHFDDIPDFLFTDYIPRYEADKSLFEQDIAPLLRFDLIILDGEKFDMHRLVQHSTRSWLMAHHEMHQRVREAQFLVAQAFPDISAGFEHWEKCQALLPHAEATLSLDAGPENERQRLQRGKILYNIAYFEYIKGDHAAALQHFSAAKEIQSAFLSDNDKRLVQTRTMCYRLLSELGQREEALRRVNSELLDLRQRGRGSVYLLALLEEKARIMSDDGDWAKAERYAREGLQLMMQGAGDGLSEVHKLDAKRTLARAINFQGEPEQAEPLLREVFDRRKQLWSIDHADTLKSLVDLAQCLANQGRYDEAERLFTTADARLRKVHDIENRRAEKIGKVWQEARKQSQEHGFARLQQKLHRLWRLTKLRVLGSNRTLLSTHRPKSPVAVWWRYTILASVALGLSLLAYSPQVWQLSDRLEELLGHQKKAATQMQANEAKDRNQDEDIKELRKAYARLEERLNAEAASSLHKQE